jgi:hypothetical protein
MGIAHGRETTLEMKEVAQNAVTTPINELIDRYFLYKLRR